MIYFNYSTLLVLFQVICKNVTVNCRKSVNQKTLPSNLLMTEAFYIIVFRSAPFGKRVGRRKKGEDLFKADRRRTKVRRGRIWTKERQKQSKNEGSRRVPTYETALPQVFYHAETLLLRFVLLSFGLRLFNKPYMPRIARRILM